MRSNSSQKSSLQSSTLNTHWEEGVYVLGGKVVVGTVYALVGTAGTEVVRELHCKRGKSEGIKWLETENPQGNRVQSDDYN